MGDEVVKVILGLALAFGTAQFAKGGLRWRALNQAKHELEVAQVLPDGDELATQLRERASRRLERYLHVPTPQEQATNAKLVYYAVQTSLVLAVVAYVYVARPNGWELAGGVLAAACVFAGARELNEGTARGKVEKVVKSDENPVPEGSSE